MQNWIYFTIPAYKGQVTLIIKIALNNYDYRKTRRFIIAGVFAPE